MKARDWVAAVRANKIAHQWAPLRLEAGGHVAVLRVSADAVRVVHDGERIRETAGAYAYQQIADLLGALMPTAKILEERHRQASVKIEPMVAPLVKPGGTVGTVRPREASFAIDQAIQKTADVTPGPWLVSNVGKQFVLDRGCSDKVAVNHGFIVPASACRDGRWRGTPTVESVALGPNWRVIQRRGMAHGFGPDADQDDYSQTVILVDDVCELDGVEFPTAELYTNPKLCALVTHDGVPLFWSRHPNVPHSDAAATVAAPAPAPAPARTTAVFLPAQKTPASPEAVYAALQKVWRDRFNEEPKRESLLVLLAQWAFETGRGKAMWNFNLGNQKGKPDGSDGRNWTFFACNELLPTTHAYALLAKAGLRSTGSGEKNVAITATKGDTATVWFYPDHPACCFRAYRTLEDGAVDYLALLHKRFAKAWPAVLAGDPAQFSHLLKASRYYTADEAHYTKNLSSIFLEFTKKFR